MYKHWLFIICIIYSSSAIASTWQLVYSSNFNGELKPCGCSVEGNLGGILRRATKLKEIKSHHQDTVLVSAGDILGPVTEQGIIKASYMLEGIKTYQMDAILPAEQDLAYDKKLLFNSNLPWVLTNQAFTNETVTDPVLFPAKQYQQRFLSTGERIVIFGLLDPVLMNTKNKQLVTQPQAALSQAFDNADIQKNDIVILLLHTKHQDIDTYRNNNLIDIIVQGHIDKPVDKKLITGKVVSAGHRGQRIGVAEYDTGNSSQQLSNTIITLPSNIIDHQPLTKLYDEYNKEITAWYRNKTSKMKATSHNDSPYSQAGSCKLCHADSYSKWQTTRHSQALKSLQQVKKDSDPECLVCHTTGFNHKGGFISDKLTADKANVQCESCHGAGREHANYPKVQRSETASTKCLNCHTKEISPAYNFSTYFPKIMHPQLQPAAVHNQSLSEIIGVYDVINKNKAIITRKQIELVEFFNFYCNRCYVLNNNRNDLYDDLPKPVTHIEYPIIFGVEQKPWAAYAYLAAKNSGKAQAFKDAVFKAKFEDKADIDSKGTIIEIAKSLNLNEIIKKAISKESADINQQYNAIVKLKEKYKLYATPTLIINDNLLLLPKHTADNTNLLIENTKEILLDMQCRQYAMCN